jgi:uncharacterized protein
MNALEIIANNGQSALGSGQNLPSPCVSVCGMEADSGLCGGCWRNLDEIARWSTMAEADKRVVWTRIGQRVAQRLEALP